ncbi:hypothetical protein NKH18_19675 [Streptomyces sp. M10(2022)]
MENWREGTRSGHTHEPNEVTIQLDGLGRQLSELDAGEPGRPENTDGPVFVDEAAAAARPTGGSAGCSPRSAPAMR